MDTATTCALNVLLHPDVPVRLLHTYGTLGAPRTEYITLHLNLQAVLKYFSRDTRVLLPDNAGVTREVSDIIVVMRDCMVWRSGTDGAYSYRVMHTNPEEPRSRGWHNKYAAMGALAASANKYFSL